MSTLAEIEQQKVAMLSNLDGWSAARLAYRSAAGCWSTGEVIDHLVKTEVEILAAARQGSTERHRVGLRDKLGTAFIERIFRTDRRVKVPPTVTRVLPSRDPVMGEVTARWDEARTELHAFAGQLTSEQMRLGLARHPVGGWMTMMRILGFFSVHMIHHGFQLDRLRSGSEGL